MTHYIHLEIDLRPVNIFSIYFVVKNIQRFNFLALTERVSEGSKLSTAP